MSKKEAIMCRLVIGLGLAVLMLMWIFAELGIAVWFDIQYQGMPYMDYILNVYASKPALYISGIISAVAAIVIFTEMTYREVAVKFLVKLKNS